LWLVGDSNGIGEFFATKATLEEVCLKDTNGTSCYNRTQLDSLLASAGSALNPPPPSTPTPEPTADTTAPVITLTGDAVINLNVGDVYNERGSYGRY
jgi:hypothetical protein